MANRKAEALAAGTRVGVWTVKSGPYSVPGTHQRKYECACECGRIAMVFEHSLRAGKSLGCATCGQRKAAKSASVARRDRHAERRAELIANARAAADLPRVPVPRNRAYVHPPCVCGQDFVDHIQRTQACARGGSRVYSPAVQVEAAE